MSELFDVAIVGGGVSGFSAAMYSGRFNMKTIIFSDLTGGVITTTDTVENYPGFKKVTGQELADYIIEHAKEYGIKIVEDKVEKTEKDGKGFKLWTTSGKEFHAKAIIFTTGTVYKKLNIPGEKELANRGVHYCALCDGAIYKGKKMAVVGSGDSAAKEALVLTQWGSEVHMLIRGDKLKAEPVNLARVKANEKIKVHFKVNVKEIKGEKKVSHVVLDRELNGSKEFPLDALFVEIGHIPLSDLAKSLGVKTNDKGEITIDRESKTSVHGVFAAGDVVDTKFKQAITGVGEAVVASYSAYQYCTSQEIV